MTEFWIGLGSAIGGILLSLVVTTLYNKLIGLPKKRRLEEEKKRQERETMMRDNEERDRRLACLEEEVSHYPQYREQSRQIQRELQNTDREILATCKAIQEDVVANREVVLDRLSKLESRNKNSLRAKILDEYRLFIDDRKNPMHAWSEMEHHSFFELVRDYEELGGNDYVHSVVLPDMNKLHVIPMHDLKKLKELYESRQVK